MFDKMDLTYQKFDPADAKTPAAILAYRPDLVFPALHGPGGEDGCMQGFLETAQIPYVGSGVAASAICMNKLYTKWAFEALKVPTPRWALVEPYIYMERRGVEKNNTLPPFPVVAKPLTEGSSVGVEFIKNEEDLRALIEKKKIPMLVEEQIIGRELTLPMFGRPMDLLPVIEIRPKAEFFDFDAKYTKGMTEYICPADISPQLREELRRYAELLCHALDLRHMCRIDVMLSNKKRNQAETLPGMSASRAPEGTPYFLEINTLPGMTGTSLLPMSARSAGMDFPALIGRFLEMAGGKS